MIPKRAIIIGGGDSINEGISKNLWSKIEGEFTVGCNASYHHFIPTVLTFVDSPFYTGNKDNLAKLPLVIGKNHSIAVCGKHPNFILVPTTNKYDPTLQKGVYASVLVGLFAMTIAIYLGVKELYLLGFDWTTKNYKKKDKHGRVVTHYYQEDESLKHRGIGKVSFYNGHPPETYFKVYEKQPVEIYNVSLISNIPNFPKISYDEFFHRLGLHQYISQDEVRKSIREKLTWRIE